MDRGAGRRNQGMPSGGVWHVDATERGSDGSIGRAAVRSWRDEHPCERCGRGPGWPVAQNIDNAWALSITTQANPATAVQVNTAIAVRRRRSARS